MPLKELLKETNRVAQGTLREDSISVTDDLKSARVVLIEEGPGNPVDCHYYTASCLQNAIEEQVFEGLPAFLNHPTYSEEFEQPERDESKKVGWYENAAWVPATPPRVRGHVEADFFPEIGREDIMNKLRTAKVYAERHPGKDYVGWSIALPGYTDYDEESAFQIGEQTYYPVVKLESEGGSVDIVTRAGAGGRLLTFREYGKQMAVTSTQRNGKGGKTAKESSKPAKPAKPDKEGTQEGNKTVIQLIQEHFKKNGKELSDDDAKLLEGRVRVVNGKLELVPVAREGAEGTGSETNKDQNHNTGRSDGSSSSGDNSNRGVQDDNDPDEDEDDDDTDSILGQLDDNSTENEEEDEEEEVEDTEPQNAGVQEALKQLVNLDLNKLSEADLRATVKKIRKGLKENGKVQRGGKKKLHEALRLEKAKRIVLEAGIPENHRNRCIREMVTFGKTEEAMQQIASEYKETQLPSFDGTGSVVRESSNSSKGFTLDCLADDD